MEPVIAAPDTATFASAPSLSPPERPLPPVGLPAMVALAAMVTGAFAVFAWALVAQHRAFNSNAFDLGFFDQVIWNTSQGHWFETSFAGYNFLGQHMEPVLLIPAAAYRLHPSISMLLGSQAAVAAAAAVPLFIAGRHLLHSTGAGLAVAAAYLLSPQLHGAVLFDFHPELFGPAAIFTAFALLACGRPAWALGAVATVFLLKEDAALVGIGFALVLWLFGYRRHALVLVVGSLHYAVLVFGVAMPALRGGPGDLQERFGYLGDDNHAIAVGALTRPHVALAHLTAAPQREALLYTLAALAFLPLTSAAVFSAAPLLAANLLSTHPPQHDLTLHYPVLAFALLIVSAVIGIARLSACTRIVALTSRITRPFGGPRQGFAALLLVAASLAWLLGSTLGPRRFDAARYQRTEHDRQVEHLLAAIPPGAAVSAQSGLVPHLSQRRDIWEFPRLEHAEYVLIDRAAWRSSQSGNAGYDQTARDLPRLGFCLVAERDGAALYRRGAGCTSPS